MTGRSEGTAQTVPAVLERYEFLDKVGEGGFGDVYKARQQVKGSARGGTEAPHVVGPRSSTPRPSEGERRQVTVVCCTLSATGSEDDDLEVEELDALLDAEHEACAVIARRFGGHLDSALSDTTLFLFGYPTAREDDAQRAARAALAMIAEVHRRSVATAKRHEARVKMRVEMQVGVHTGIIVTRGSSGAASQRGHRIGGATPQTASRLSALAHAGEVLVSGATYRLLRARFELEEHSPSAQAGAPPEVYRLLGSRGTLGVRDLPLVGRERDLEALVERWQRARSGKGQIMLVSGEAGIGKSRLARALREQIGAEVHLALEGRCVQEAMNTPLHPFIDLLHRWLDPRREHAAEGKAALLGALLERHGFDLAEAMPLFTSLLALPLPAPYVALDLTPQRQRELTHGALLSLLFEASERASGLLVLEDLHWADASTLEVCTALASDASAGKLLAVFTARPGFTPPWSASVMPILQLGHLERADVVQMAAAIGGGRALSSEVVDWILARTDGVPLFVEELVQMLLESGTLVEREGHLVLAAGFDQTRIPSTLRDSLAARLDRLGPAREAAQVAAAIGRDFGFEVLRAVLDVDARKLREELDTLVAADLVYHRRRLRNPSYIFKHALVQDTAYDTMPKGRRREVHGRIARTLERDFPEVGEAQPEILARHWETAESLSKASTYLLHSGRRALGRGANKEAMASLKKGITLLDGLPEDNERWHQEFALRSALGGALVPVTGYAAPEVTDNLLQARELGEKIGDPTILFPVLYGLCTNNMSAGRREMTERCATQLSEFALAHPAPMRDVTAHFTVGVTHFYRGRLDQGWRALDQAIASYDTSMNPRFVELFGDDHGLFALGHRAWLEAMAGRADQARTSTCQARELAEHIGHPLTSILAMVFSVIVHRELRDVERTYELSEKVTSLVTAQGFPFWYVNVRRARGWARAMLGDHDDWAAEIEEISRSHELIEGMKPSLVLYRAALGEVYLRAGRHDDGLLAIDQAIADGWTSSVSFYQPEFLRLKGDLVAARSGDPEAGIPHYEQAIAVAQEHGAVYHELHAVTRLARALLSCRGGERAGKHLTETMAKMVEGHDTPVYREAAEVLTEIAAAGWR
ncbi:AAA family ATPase [Chondromyces apiculatus]|uniref:Adenylate cyclase n=1 Tax=Chondromyces apiculatus DSM 436 TaxID=1192034 RepID=A0A017TDS3_9BACT|nr:AAA family ATPase [Chondromyces apiculatus]EYF06960.1 Adenylate cyclase [Chondromyces apiculatus DSM 436]